MRKTCSHLKDRSVRNYQLLVMLLLLACGVNWYVATSRADEPCGVWEHLGWLPGTVTWTADSNGNPQASISNATEYCGWSDPCEGTTQDDQANPVAYTLISDEIVPDGDGYKRQYSWRADSGCNGTSIWAFASHPLLRIWDTDSAISGGELIAPANGTSVIAGATVNCAVAQANDSDHWTEGPGSGNSSDSITYKWAASGGSFDNVDSRTPTWTAPQEAGAYTLTCTIDDGGIVPQGDAGTRDDAPVVRTFTVYVVAIAGLEYRIDLPGTEDDAGPFTPYTDTLSVPIGTTIIFKAIKTPAEGSWPNGKPVWGGSAGATGTGETKSVTFNTQSTTSTDYKTVTAECGNTVTANVLVTDLVVTVSAVSDHIEADGQSTSTISVNVKDRNGNPVADKVVTLTTSLGTLQDTTFITDSQGNGVIDINENGVADAGEPGTTILTASETGGIAKIKASVEVGEGMKNVVIHKVQVTDFGAPKLLIYDPESDDSQRQNPSFTFTISDEPQIATSFSVTFSIHTLNGPEAITTVIEELEPGTYTRNWSDFFYTSGEEEMGREVDPGRGIYPFQIEAVVSAVNTEMLEEQEIAYTGCSHADWKSSKTLNITWTNDYIFYDQFQQQTKVGYVLDIVNNKRPAPPVEAKLVVYDPALVPVQEVPLDTVPDPLQSNRFSCAASFPLSMESAGKYHFVVEARQADDLAEGKDRNKWALERNGSRSIPTYVTFGAGSPAAVIGGQRYGGVLDGSTIATQAANHLHTMGYRRQRTPVRHWWMQNYIGGHTSGFNNVEHVVGPWTQSNVPLSVQKIQQQAIQYNAVWLYVGHGANGNIMAIWDSAQGDLTNRAEVGADDPAWSYLTARTSEFSVLPAENSKRSLDSLPHTYSGGNVRGNDPNAWGPTKAKLAYSRLVCFMGCTTANDTAYDLPSEAVRSGARSSIGFLSPVAEPNLRNFSWHFFNTLRQGYNVEDAAEYAASGTVGVGNVKVIGALTEVHTPLWGNIDGPELR